MFSLKKRIANIRCIASDSDVIVVAQRENNTTSTSLIILKKDSLSALASLDVEIEIGSIGYAYDNFFVLRSGYDGKGYLLSYNAETISIETLLPAFMIKVNPFLIQNDWIHAIDKTTSPRKNYQYNLRTKQLSNLIEGGIIEYNFNCVYSNDIQKKELSLYHTETGQIKWQLGYGNYITQDYPQFNILTIHQNQLICTVNQDRILGIDVTTGEVIWEVTEMQDLEGKQMNEFYLADYAGITDEKIIFCSGVLYTEFELSTKTFSIKKIFAPINDLLSAELFINRSTLQHELMYFTSENKKTRTWHTVGVFNIKTLEVVWTTDLDLPKTVFLNNAPLVDDNYLYVTDSANTLHIFEKENH